MKPYQELAAFVLKIMLGEIKPSASTLGGRLEQERKKFGLNQTDFASIGGVRLGAQGQYERNVRVPGAHYLQAIAKAGADVLFILLGEESQT